MTKCCTFISWLLQTLIGHGQNRVEHTKNKQKQENQLRPILHLTEPLMNRMITHRHHHYGWCIWCVLLIIFSLSEQARKPWLRLGRLRACPFECFTCNKSQPIFYNSPLIYSVGGFPQLPQYKKALKSNRKSGNFRKSDFKVLCYFMRSLQK